MEFNRGGGEEEREKKGEKGRNVGTQRKGEKEEE